MAFDVFGQRSAGERAGRRRGRDIADEVRQREHVLNESARVAADCARLDPRVVSRPITDGAPIRRAAIG